jgi:hypothetical protein
MQPTAAQGVGRRVRAERQAVRQGLHGKAIVRPRAFVRQGQGSCRLHHTQGKEQVSGSHGGVKQTSYTNGMHRGRSTGRVCVGAAALLPRAAFMTRRAPPRAPPRQSGPARLAPRGGLRAGGTLGRGPGARRAPSRPSKGGSPVQSSPVRDVTSLEVVHAVRQPVLLEEVVQLPARPLEALLAPPLGWLGWGRGAGRVWDAACLGGARAGNRMDRGGSTRTALLLVPRRRGASSTLCQPNGDASSAFVVGQPTAAAFPKIAGPQPRARIHPPTHASLAAPAPAARTRCPASGWPPPWRSAWRRASASPAVSGGACGARGRWWV